jgi:hypothetical protein
MKMEKWGMLELLQEGGKDNDGGGIFNYDIL